MTTKTKAANPTARVRGVWMADSLHAAAVSLAQSERRSFSEWVAQLVADEVARRHVATPVKAAR